MNLFESLPEPLEAQKERELLCSNRENLEVRDALLMHSMKEAMRYAAACARGMIPMDEIMSLCTVALLKAIGNYDTSNEKKLRLIQFAKPYIRGQIQKAWRERNPVRYGAEIPDPVPGEYPDENPGAFSEGHDDPDFDGIHARERWEWVKPHLCKLSETESRVLILLFESRFSMAEIGRMLGCTRANVHVTKNRAMKKIRNGLYRDKKYVEVN